MLSGYKALSRRFVKSFPALSTGFEIETELLVHALEVGMPAGEIETPYKERPAGSESKLRTFHDGARILRLITRLVKEERPLVFFSILALFLAVGPTMTMSSRWPSNSGGPGSCQASNRDPGHRSDAHRHHRSVLRNDPGHGDARARELKRLHYLSLPSVTEAMRLTSRIGGSSSPARRLSGRCRAC